VNFLSLFFIAYDQLAVDFFAPKLFESDLSKIVNAPMALSM